jgi:GT2 family glycosyltransferase
VSQSDSADFGFRPTFFRGWAVRVAEIIASATQRYPELDGSLSVGAWPVFVRNALDPVDPAKT